MSTFRRAATPRKPENDPISTASISHERIPIFMIVEKDASESSDKRHVNKKIANVNLLTQKKTGGKRIMGNQGMTNWKFSAFLAIALMLVAGLFSTTAMAADGDGRIRSTTPANPSTERHEAGSILATLVFSYTLAASTDSPSDMAGGMFEMQIPTGWAFAAADTPNTGDAAGGTAVTGQGTDGAHLSTAGASRIRVRLGDEWSGTAAQTLTITLTRVTVPNPDRLTDGNRDDRYEEYEFTSYSRTRSGRLRELDNIVLREGDTNPLDGSTVPNDGDGVANEVVRTISGQPFARVGNIGDAKGTVVITPDKVYETYGAEEGPRRIVLKFTAVGPMWNSLVDVVIPQELDGISAAQLAAFQPSGSLTPTGHSGHLRLVNIGGSEVSINLDATTGTQGVDDGEGDTATTAGGAQTIRINVKAMDKNQGFEMIYYSEIPTVSARSAVTDFIVRTDTTPTD